MTVSTPWHPEQISQVVDNRDEGAVRREDAGEHHEIQTNTFTTQTWSVQCVVTPSAKLNQETGTRKPVRSDRRLNGPQVSLSELEDSSDDETEEEEPPPRAWPVSREGQRAFFSGQHHLQRR